MNHVYLNVIGVYLSLNGVYLTNNSNVLITDIGTTSQPLVCTTDRIHCCRGPYRNGEWYYPEQDQLLPVPSMYGGTTTFYRNRSLSGEINLFRWSSHVTYPTGTFCCVVQDAVDVTQTVCANIGESVSV